MDELFITTNRGEILKSGTYFVFVMDNFLQHTYGIRKLVAHPMAEEKWYSHDLEKNLNWGYASPSMFNSLTVLRRCAVVIPDNIAELDAKSIIGYIKLRGITVANDEEDF